MDVKTIAVIGAGTMGRGIAYASALAGFQTVLEDVSDSILAKALDSVRDAFEEGVRRGKVDPAAREAALALISTSRVVDEAIRDAELIIEAVPEELEMKLELFTIFDKFAKPNAIFASNTSSLTITEIAAATRRPQRFVGLHFFNPVPVMKLVEVVKTIATDPAVYEEMVAFGAKLGKTPVRANDSGGFIVNRLLVPYLLDAIRALEEGVGSVVDIDNSMKLGCGYPMGPFALLDFVGLDTTYYISQIMFDEFKEKRFAAPPLLKRMVLAGWNGKKSGRGFYDYSDSANPKAMSL